MLGLAISGWIACVFAMVFLWVRSCAGRSTLNRDIHELRRPLQQAYLLSPGVERSSYSLSAALDHSLVALDDLDAHVNRGHRVARYEPVDIRSLVEDSLEMQRSLRAQGLLRLEWRAREGKVFGDPHRLRRIFDNLLDNAARHGTAPLEVSARDSGGFIRVAVENPGGNPGSEVTSPKSLPGHGYGLRIIRELVREHGGHFSFTNRRDRYEAVVDLPLAGS